MGKIIKFPMSTQMIRRVNQNQSYERAYLLAMGLLEKNRESKKLLAEAEKERINMEKLFGKK